MYWNHRVVNRIEENDGEDWFVVCEVYYNENNQPCGYCDATVGSETMEELKTTIERITKAYEQPVLTKANFVGNLFEDEEEGHFVGDHANQGEVNEQ